MKKLSVLLCVLVWVMAITGKAHAVPTFDLFAHPIGTVSPTEIVTLELDLTNIGVETVTFSSNGRALTSETSEVYSVHHLFGFVSGTYGEYTRSWRSGGIGDDTFLWLQFVDETLLPGETMTYKIQDLTPKPGGVQVGDYVFGSTFDLRTFTSGVVSSANDRHEFTVSPVPEPATILLIGTGLVGLVGFRKKFKK
jgi:hypothetical protein